MALSSMLAAQAGAGMGEKGTWIRGQAGKECPLIRI